MDGCLCGFSDGHFSNVLNGEVSYLHQHDLSCLCHSPWRSSDANQGIALTELNEGKKQ